VAALVIRYRNGQIQRQPIQHLVHVSASWGNQPTETENAQLAWIGSTVRSSASQSAVRLYRYTWPNPHPEWEIATADLESSQNGASYVLVAMTAE
jgi:hypothetical protein